jgi:hypothetical protein
MGVAAGGALKRQLGERVAPLRIEYATQVLRVARGRPTKLVTLSGEVGISRSDVDVTTVDQSLCC